MAHYRTLLLALFVSLMCLTDPSAAQRKTPFFPVDGTRPAGCGEGGQIREKSDPSVANGAAANFDVFLFDCHGNRIGDKPWKQLKGKDLTIDLPGTFMGIKVGGARNDTYYGKQRKYNITVAGSQLSADGASASFDLVSLYRDTQTGLVQFEGFLGRLTALSGPGVQVAFPDVYADTNADGALDPDDILYSLVDFNQYLRAMTPFAFGDAVDIIDSQADGFAGMLFSTTPFVSNPLAPTGFDFTPFTGDGVVLSLHAFTAAAEPPSAALVLLAWALAAYGLGHRGPRGSSSPLRLKSW
jgi:hypothetical protein